jgi:hypothetical protein
VSIPADDLDARVEAALGAADAEAALIALVQALYAEGLDEDEVLDLLGAAQLRRRAREAAGQPTDEAAEDALVSVADRVAGFCSPHAALRRTSGRAQA